MRDRITDLCTTLLKIENPSDIYPTARELRSAISEKIESIRSDARLLELLTFVPPHEDRPETVTMEAHHVHRREHESANEAKLA